MASVRCGTGLPQDHAQIESILQSEGLRVGWWSNAPESRYDWHAHGYDKVLVCQSGSITFHTDDGDVELLPGDRLDLDAGTRHAATVGGSGVTCAEGHR